jgi:hypothetical protein
MDEVTVGTENRQDDYERWIAPDGDHLMQLKPRIAPCLWFDSQAEQAAAF